MEFKYHFKYVLKKYAEKHQLTIGKFEKKYQNNSIHKPELDPYFLHDGSIRESGHDTTTRLDNVAADLNPVALNALLHQLETDFAYLINLF